MGSRHHTSGIENMPGPGSYSALQTQSKRRAPSAKVGTQPRGFYKTSDVPGPGNYSPNSSPKSRKAPAFIFGSENRSQNNNAMRNNPGPGNYECYNTIGTG